MKYFATRVTYLLKGKVKKKLYVGREEVPIPKGAKDFTIITRKEISKASFEMYKFVKSLET